MQTAVGARFDYVKFDQIPEYWDITATVAQTITDGLTGKVEYRYDKDSGSDVDANTIYVQMMYEF